MSLKQAQIARELKVSPSVVSDNVAAGMPLDSMEAVLEWRRRHVTPKHYAYGVETRNLHGKGSNITAPNNYGWERADLEYVRNVQSLNREISEGWEKFKNRRPPPRQNPRTLSPGQLLASWAIAGMIETGCCEESAVERVQELFRPAYYHDAFDR